MPIFAGTCRPVWAKIDRCLGRHRHTGRPTGGSERSASHKKTCTPFSAANTATLKPHYQTFDKTVPTVEFYRSQEGYPTQNSIFSTARARAANTPKDLDLEGAKSIVIKVQVPYTGPGHPVVRSTGDLMVYTKKRDFAGSIRRADSPEEYERISEVVRTRGVGGAKAYFAAELESKEKLVVKISDVLAEQPW